MAASETSQSKWIMTQKFIKAKKWEILQWPSQSPDLILLKNAFHLLKTNLKAQTQKQVAAEGSCSKGLTEHLKE